MQYLVALIALLLAAGFAAAAPQQGMFSAGSTRFLSIDAATDTSFEFTLDIGVADGDARCAEGDVSCLSIAGEANGVADRFVYVSPDGEGEITFELGNDTIRILDASGTLGSGSGNAQQLPQILGLYEMVAQDAEAASQRGDVYFQTPSGNIICVIISEKEGFIRCDIRQLTQTYTKAPDGCELDWGTAFGIAADGNSGEVICHGDTLFGTEPMKLEYGKTVEAGGFQCLSEKTGLTCKNAAGHGFRLSKARQKLF
jgi:hypothetical protein